MRTKSFKIIALAMSLALLPAVIARASDRVRIGGDVVVEKGVTVKDAVAVGGDVTVNGVVKNSAVAVGGSVFLGPDAVVRRDVVAIGGVIARKEGARIGGDIVELNIPGLTAVLPFMSGERSFGWLAAFETITFAGMLALALLVVALLPGSIDLISESVKQNTLKVILSGILGALVVIPLALFLVISVVGIPLVVIEILLIGCAMFVGYIAMALFLGSRLAAAFNRPGLNMLWMTSMGLVILWVIGWVPFVGPAVKSIAAVLGFGAVLVTVFGSISRRRQAQAV